MDTQRSDRLPIPRFVARVGVTGHRPNNAAYAKAKLDDVIRAILERVDNAVRAAHEIHRADYAEDPPTIRMMSGLAEGADQLVATLRPDGWLLDAILPMPIAKYRRDFTDPGRCSSVSAVDGFDALLNQAETVIELPCDQDGADDSASYARQGRMLVRQTDLLIAIWDGAPGRGAGGTSDVVAFARLEGVPVLWVPVAAGAHSVLLLSPEPTASQDLTLLTDVLSKVFNRRQALASPAAALPSARRPPL